MKRPVSMPRAYPALSACLATCLSAGCSSISGLDGESRYACQAPIGVACDSVSGTYANALRNTLPGQIAAPTQTATTEGGTPPPVTVAGTPTSNTRPTSTAAGPASLVPLVPLTSASTDASPTPSMGNMHPDAGPTTPWTLRSQQRVLRLWIQAWEDRDGDLHDQAYVYVLVDGGRWRMPHIRRQIRISRSITPPVSSTLSHGSTAATALPSQAQAPQDAPTEPRDSPLFGQRQQPLPQSSADAVATPGVPLDANRERLQRDRP